MGSGFISRSDDVPDLMSALTVPGPAWTLVPTSIHPHRLSTSYSIQHSIQPSTLNPLYSVICTQYSALFTPHPSLPQPTELDLTEPDGLAFGLEGDVAGAELEVRAGIQEIGRG